MVLATVRFAGDLPPSLVIGVALVAAGMVVWAYLRESKTVASPYSYLLPGLRASAVALAIMVLAGPVWHHKQTIGTLGRVVFAVDTSQSMSITDSGETESSPTRLERSLRLLTGSDDKMGWLELLSQTHVVDVIEFSSGDWSTVWSSREDETIPSALDLHSIGRRTDLSAGLTGSLSTVATAHVDQLNGQGGEALVLMTDGRHNLGDSPMDVADRLQSAGIEVYALGMGSQEEPIDTGIVNVVRPDTVASDGNLAGQIVVQQFGRTADEDVSSVMVRIESGGTVVWQDSVDFGNDAQQTVPFELDVESIVQRVRDASPRGVRRNTVVMDLQAIVQAVPGDTNVENNSLPFRVAASSRDRRLLILDGSSRWEMRYIRNLFERDPAWSVDTLLYGSGTDMPMLRRGDKSGQFPNTREAMAAYDAIILGEIPPDQFSVADGDLLRDFVARGGGLIVIDGRYERLKRLVRQSLSDLVPVEYIGNEYPFPVRSIRPTQMGLDHPVLNLWGERTQLTDFWEQIPAPPLALRVRAQTGAEVWAYAVATDGRESPWLITRLFGAGRVFYTSTDQTWRWRYKVADRFHARFWNQLLLAVMQPPYSASDDYVALGTNKIEYEDGESATVRVRLQDTSGRPVGNATVDALLVANNEIVATVPLTVDDPARGTYRGQTLPLDPGAYDIRIRASGFDANALQATTPIWVGSRDAVELGQGSLNEPALIGIAQAGGGKYVHESNATQMFEQLRPLSRGSVVESDILVWQSFYWFWAIMLLLTIEWWMRKKAGLV